MHKSKGPLDVVVANLNAKTLLKHHGVLYDLRQMCNGDTYLLLSTSIEGMWDELNGLMLRRGIRRIYGYGGDRTQASILDWLQSMPDHLRPDFVPLPAGQMNLLAKSCGFDGDPVLILNGILRGDTALILKRYHPLLVQDPESGARRHSIVMADGVVYEFIRAYDQAGKGNKVVVAGWILGIVLFWLVRKFARAAYLPLSAAVPVLPKLARKDRHPLFRRHRGMVSLGGATHSRADHYGFVLSTLSVLPAGIRPFRASGMKTDQRFWSILYWGPVLPVIKSLWGLWTGNGNLPHMQPWMFNRPVKEAEVELPGGWVFDGDPEPCALVSANPGIPINKVRVTVAPPVSLLVNASSSSRT